MLSEYAEGLEHGLPRSTRASTHGACGTPLVIVKDITVYLVSVEHGRATWQDNVGAQNLVEIGFELPDALENGALRFDHGLRSTDISRHHNTLVHDTKRHVFSWRRTHLTIKNAGRRSDMVISATHTHHSTWPAFSDEMIGA